MSGLSEIGGSVRVGAYRYMAGALVGWVVLLAVAATRAPSLWQAIWQVVFALVSAGLVACFTVRPAIHWDDKGVVVQNPFRRREIPWESICSLRLFLKKRDPRGLVIGTIEGEEVAVWAVNPTAFSWGKRAKHLAGELNAHLGLEVFDA